MTYLWAGRGGYARRSPSFHGLRVVYETRITGGELRHETNGSTDMAAWHPLDEVPTLDRVALVDIGLALWRQRPVLGRIDPEPRAR